MGCVFCRIVAEELPTTLIYQDERVIAFEDIRPQAPVHVLVVPRQHVPSLWELEEQSLAGALLLAAAAVARQLGLERGWRLIANTRGDGGQEVDHLHLHVLGGRRLPPMLARESR
jgi:histidine triad (HIT) family protein